MQVILNRAQYQYLRDNSILEQYKTNIKNVYAMTFAKTDRN